MLYRFRDWAPRTRSSAQAVSRPAGPHQTRQDLDFARPIRSLHQRSRLGEVHLLVFGSVLFVVVISSSPFSFPSIRYFCPYWQCPLLRLCLVDRPIFAEADAFFKDQPNSKEVCCYYVCLCFSCVFFHILFVCCLL